MLKTPRLLFVPVVIALGGSVLLAPGVPAGALAGTATPGRPASAVRTSAATPAPVQHPIPAARRKLPAVSPAPVGSADQRRAHALAQTQAPAGSADHPTVAHLDPQLYKVAGVPGADGVDPVPTNADGSVEVVVTGSAVPAAARAVGARLGVSYAGATVVTLAPSKLTALAAQPGVANIAQPTRAVPQVISEGVHASGADAWQSAAPALGNEGAGVNVAIVDAGFGNLAAEEQAGNLDSSEIVYVRNPSNATDPANMDHCADDSATDHGTAVAEIVHQMAPNATLYLYCVDNSQAFNYSASQIVARGNIKIVNSSLGFPGEARGDGYAGSQSTEAGVKKAREAGVLWIQSAGNAAQDHWSGTLADKGGERTASNPHGLPDGYVDLQDVNNEGDLTALDPGASGDIVLTWDQWPSYSVKAQLEVDEYSIDPSGAQQLVSARLRSPSSASPSIDMFIQNASTQANDVHLYDIYVRVPASAPTVHYDLFYTGDVYPSYLSGQDANRAAAGSMLEPATSPWALAVGAADWRTHLVEPFSSRGLTIDQRVKPDLIGFDGTASNITDVESTQLDSNNQPIPSTTGFYGTSAAAPHVAGAAALIKAANPAMDAGQIEAFLEAPDNGQKVVSPPTTGAGHGVLSLGAADPSLVVPAAGSQYHLFPQAQRIADTRSGLGGVPKQMMGAGSVVTVPLPTSGADAVPANATSAVVLVSGTAARGSTYLSVYSSTFGGNSTLNLNAADPNASVTAVVTISAAHNFKLRNAAAATDALITLLGYFGSTTDTTGDNYRALSPVRVLDTRSGLGGPRRKLGPNQAVTVSTGLPSDAAVAAVTITALDQNRNGYLTAFPNAYPPVSSVDYGHFTRSNLVLVPVVNGKFTLQNRVGTADALVDVSGYFSPKATARFVAETAPIRIVDTRTGNGGRHAAMTANSVVSVDGGGIYGVPYRASALWLNITAIASADGYLSVYPYGQSMPHSSNVDYTKARAVPNAAIATMSAATASRPPALSTVVRAGNIELLEDNYGYFIG